MVSKALVFLSKWNTVVERVQVIKQKGAWCQTGILYTAQGPNTDTFFAHFKSVFHFYTPISRENRKLKGGGGEGEGGIEMERWSEIGSFSDT